MTACPKAIPRRAPRWRRTARIRPCRGAGGASCGSSLRRRWRSPAACGRGRSSSTAGATGPLPCAGRGASRARCPGAPRCGCSREAGTCCRWTWTGRPCAMRSSPSSRRGEMAKYVLAIDQGTTGTTALVLDQRLAVRGKRNVEFRQIFPRPGWVEHDLEDIWASTLKAVSGALRDASVKPARLEAVGITNQRETTLLWDRRTGRPIHNAIVWQDRRTADACNALRAAGKEPWVREKTGLVLDAYFSATKVRWMLDNVKGARVRAERGELAFGTVDSFLLWRLTGGAVHATDVSNASRTLLFNIHTLDWDDELLAMFGVPLPIGGVAGDQQAAAFGQACYTPGMVKNTYGTGSFLLMNTGPTPRP